MRVFDTANSIGHPSCARAIFAGSSRSWPDQCADRLSPVTTPARWRRVSVAAILASIAMERKGRHRPRDISRRIRTREKSSREQSGHSACMLKHEGVAILEDASVRQMRSTSEPLRLSLLIAKMPIRDRDYEA